ncbi:MAG TPA: phosphate ABC transporter substrate-binding protein PstS [Xanthobacteraceae bacterium]|nr:phosphate ABC transporter substrate-binding protein PstS [Xanthobacteraceae bacterium]
MYHRQERALTSFCTILAGAAVTAAMAPALAADISGAGSTFAYPIYSAWGAAYKKETGVALNYEPIGSSDGITKLQNKEVIFAASDMPLNLVDLDMDGFVQFPTLTAGVVPVVNIDGVKPGDLVLDGATLARIFLGEIKAWNDPAIRKLNPGAKLPSRPIAVVYRADGSGTTFVFTDYLNKVSLKWKTTVGSTTAVEWPVGTGVKGNEGVAASVGGLKGSIGYVEYAYAKQNKLTYTRLMNKAGKAVAPGIASFSAAAANADWEGTPGFAVVLTNEPGAASWPITGATFILMHKQPSDPAAAEALKFFHWAYAKGGKMAQELDYVPMPANVVAAVERLWAGQIQSARGGPLFVPPK